MDRMGEGTRLGNRTSSVGWIVLGVSLALAGCGGGGRGGGSHPGAGASTPPPAPPSPPPAPPPPPPPSYEINRAFRFNTPVFLGPSGDFLVNSTVIGDVTADGRPDVVVVTEGSTPEDMGRVIVFPQMASGALGMPIRAQYTTRTYTTASLALGDLDGDGTQEILVAHRDGLTVAKYQPSTQSISLSFQAAALNYSAVTTADVDTDGKLDVVVQTWSTGALIYKGDGSGGVSFLRTLETPLSGYNRIMSSDMNGDGRHDLVMTNGQGFQNWWLMLNDGAGGFGPAQAYALPRRPSDNWPWSAGGLGVGDFNGDGRKDVAVSLSSNHPAAIGIYLQQADGQYALDSLLDSYDIPEPVAVGDLDGNGRDDVVTVHGGFFNMGYYLRGESVFDPEALVNIGASWSPTSHYRPDGLALGDVNSDGCIDAAIADAQHGLILLTGKDCKQRPVSGASSLPSKALRTGFRVRVGGG